MNILNTKWTDSVKAQKSFNEVVHVNVFESIGNFLDGNNSLISREENIRHLTVQEIHPLSDDSSMSDSLAFTAMTHEDLSPGCEGHYTVPSPSQAALSHGPWRTWGKCWSLSPLNLFVVWGFSSHSRIFHSYGDVTIAGKGLQIFIYARYSWQLSSKVYLAYHTYCDTGHPFIMVISEDPWHSHLLPSV